MAPAQKILAKMVVSIGIATGAAAAAFCFYLMYPAEMNDWELRHLGAGVRIGLLVWCLVALPFAWLADRIDSSPDSTQQ